jgi:hypothetical protein
MITCEPQRREYVLGIHAACDQGRLAIDCAVPDPAGFGVRILAWLDQRAANRERSSWNARRDISSTASMDPP